MKVLVKSPFSIYSGYGNDGFSLLRALHEWGCDVYPQPTWLDVPIPRDLMPLFGKTLTGPFDLTINHWDPTDLGIRPEARAMTRCAVAWTMWEFSPAPGPATMPDGKVAKPKTGLVPHCKGRTTLAERLRWFDLFLGYDQVTLSNFEPYLERDAARGVLQGGYESRDWQPVERDWFGERFGFFMHGALNNRKQPLLAVQAFLELKDEQPGFERATLSLHTNQPGNVFPEMNDIYQGRRIRAFVGAWDKRTLEEFYAANHCAVYPSRGEGKNLPALEFLSTGGTGLFTNYGGHTGWLRSDIAYPLPYDLTPTFPQRPDAAHDAKVRISDLKAAMWQAFTNRAEAKRKGELAAQLIPQMCDWQVVVENLFRRVRDLCPHNGELIYNMAQEDRERAAGRGTALIPAGGGL